jgi:hypothetical protein
MSKKLLLRSFAALSLLLASGCAKPTNIATVCTKLKEAGVTTECKERAAKESSAVKWGAGVLAGSFTGNSDNLEIIIIPEAEGFEKWQTGAQMIEAFGSKVYTNQKARIAIFGKVKSLEESNKIQAVVDSL